MDLFSSQKRDTIILLDDDTGYVSYQNQFISSDEAVNYYQTLVEELPWKNDPIKMFGKLIPQPRLFCWVAEEGIAYSYSGLQLENHPFKGIVKELKELVEKETNQIFNACLINYYRDGLDSMGWHADNEKENGPEPFIASISLGAERKFQLKTKEKPPQNLQVNLETSSLLIMSGKLQEYWKHQIPKQPTIKEGRINLTFRKVVGK
jgi:alkylated DNA repair dioxygenase AlkB